jgi:hypothetical protein
VEAATEFVEPVAIDQIFDADAAVQEDVFHGDVRRLGGHAGTFAV